jgi:hypothetical protein
LLVRVHHLDRMAEVEPRAHLHLAEDEVRAAPDDEVELVAANASVARQDPVAAQAVVAAGAAFGGVARG